MKTKNNVWKLDLVCWYEGGEKVEKYSLVCF